MSKFLVVALVLLVIAGAGTLNYRRNAETERAGSYSGYSDEELELLIAGYEAEANSMRKLYEETRDLDNPGANRSGHLQDRIAHFNQVQKHAKKVREAGSRVGTRQLAISEVQAELDRRAEERARPWEVFFRRLLTLPRS